MKRHLSDSEPEMEDYEECSSPDTAQVVSRKKRRGIIEKRRRDRINNCLVELRRLVPAAFEKQGSAKLEKAEILQMTVDHLRHLHQTRDPRGFVDPHSAYANTRAFLDYRVMGFRECVSETARYLTNVEGMDMKDPMRVHLLNHLENFLAQRELAINAAVAASAQMGLPKLPPTPIPIQTGGAPFIPIPQRASPDTLSPPAFSPKAVTLPQLSMALPTPVISFATTSVPVFRATAIPAIGSLPTATIPTANGTAKPELLLPSSPTKSVIKTATSNKTPFRPWADTADED